jgi:hypothetical protein
MTDDSLTSIYDYLTCAILDKICKYNVLYWYLVSYLLLVNATIASYSTTK